MKYAKKSMYPQNPNHPKIFMLKKWPNITRQHDEHSNFLIVIHLFFAATQHTDDAEADGLDRQSGGPVFGKDRKTYVTVAVDVWVNWDIWTKKNHLQRTAQ